MRVFKILLAQLEYRLGQSETVLTAKKVNMRQMAAEFYHGREHARPEMTLCLEVCQDLKRQDEDEDQEGFFPKSLSVREHGFVVPHHYFMPSPQRKVDCYESPVCPISCLPSALGQGGCSPFLDAVHPSVSFSSPCSVLFGLALK